MVDVRWRIRRCTVCWDSMLSICVYVTWQRFCAESHFHRNVLLPWWHCLHHLPLPETHISCGQRKPLAFPHQLSCSCLKCAGKDLTSWKVLPPTILSCCPSGFARNVWWRLPGHCRCIRWQGGGHMLNCEKCEPEQSAWLHDVVGKGLNPVNPVNPVAGQERSIGHVSVMTSCPVIWEKSGEFNESWCPLVPRVGCSGALGGCLEMSGKPQGLLLNPKMRTREQDNEIQWTSTLLQLVGIPYAKKNVSTYYKRYEYAIVVPWSNEATCKIYIFGGEIVYRSVLAWLIATTVTALTCAAKQPRKKLSACTVIWCHYTLIIFVISCDSCMASSTQMLHMR